MIEIRILGPVRIFDGDGVLITASKPRALVTSLALSPDFTVSHDVIASQLWPGGDVVKPRAIREVASAVRLALPPGYMPDPNPHRSCALRLPDPTIVDLFHFRKMVDQAANLNGSARVMMYDKARSLWHGKPLDDLQGFDFKSERGALLREVRKILIERLRLGVQDEEIASLRLPLEQALDLFPADQEIGALVIAGLRVNGRLDDAEELCARWVDAYGELPPRLKSKAAGDRRWTHSASSRGFAIKPGGIHRQLPAHRTELVGRDAVLEAMSSILAPNDTERCGVLVLRGIPGVGKTTLALRWAGDNASAFPDGVLHADLQGFSGGSPAPAIEILTRLLDDLEILVPDRATPDRLVATFRSESASRRALIVLDNARDAEQVRPLLPANGACRTIVTSRDQLEDLVLDEGAHAIDIDVLDGEAARTLLTALLSPERLRADRHLIPELADLCGGLPLSLALVATSINGRPPGGTREVLARLREPESRLDALVLGHRSVRAAIAASTELLSDAAKEMLWKVALHPGPTISAEALAHLVGAGRCEVLRARDELVCANLLHEPVTVRFALHDAIRLVASEAAGRQPADIRKSRSTRAFDFLLHNAWACDRALVPGRNLPIGEPDDIDVITPRSPAEAMQWFSTEYETIAAAIRRAGEEGFDRYWWLLPMVLVTYQWRKSRYADAAEFLKTASEAADREADPSGRAMVCRMLVGTYLRQEQFEAAKVWQRRARTILESSGSGWGEAENEHGLGIVYVACGEWDEAIAHVSEAIRLFRERGDLVGEAGALASLAGAHLGKEDLLTARRLCEQAHQVADATSDHNRVAGIRALSGRIHLAVDDPRRALDDFDAAVTGYEAGGYERNVVGTLLALADAAARLGDRDRVRTALDRAEQVITQMGGDAGLQRQLAEARWLADS